MFFDIDARRQGYSFVRRILKVIDSLCRVVSVVACLYLIDVELKWTNVQCDVVYGTAIEVPQSKPITNLKLLLIIYIYIDNNDQV